MGFRNPITTVEAVDTRPNAAGPGARLYQQPSPGGIGTQGVLEFDDGITGDTPATLTSTPGTPRSVTGGVVALKGGSFSGTTAADLTIDVLPAGDPGLTGVPLPAGAQFGRRTHVSGADVFTVDAGTQILGDGVPILVNSDTARDNLTKYVGLTVIRQDLAARLQRWDGNGWRFRMAGTAQGTTDGNGLLSFAHGAGQAPLVWGCTPTGQQTDPLTEVFKPVAWGADATTLTVRAVRTDTSVYLTSQPIHVNWWAEF